MSIVEKVNVTTGTGWQMGMCVGNTGKLWLCYMSVLYAKSLGNV